MSRGSYIFAIAMAVLVLFVVIHLLRRRRLRERHAIWWMVAALLALLAGVFPGAVVRVSSFLGIEVPLNLLFFTSIAILFLINLQHASELTSLEEKTRILAERVALLEMGRPEESSDPKGPPAGTP
ncbi:MAG: DUF2304 domain-containing protein [Demequinaceae bacterium]|nr:DUF2304 domain-containing protein [Demequinaceae bacterium]